MKYVYWYILTARNNSPDNGVFKKYSHLAFYESLQKSGEDEGSPIERKINQGYGNSRKFDLYKMLGTEEELQKMINDESVMYDYDHQRLKMNNYKLMKIDVDQCRFERA